MPRPAYLRPTGNPPPPSPYRLRLKALGFSMATFAQWLGKAPTTVRLWNKSGKWPVEIRVLLWLLEDRAARAVELQKLPPVGEPITPSASEDDDFPEPKRKQA